MGELVKVNFRGDSLYAVEQDGSVFVAIKPICEGLGLVWAKQRARIQADPILSEGGTVTVLPSAGGPQQTFCLRLDLVNGWLFTIDESRVRDEQTRQKVLAYKRECYQTLFQHFYGKAERATGAASAHPNITGLSFNGKTIRERGQFLSLIDIWHAAGAEHRQKPTYWMRKRSSWATVKAVAKAENLLPAQAFLAPRGRVGTVAHWKIAVAYAEFLGSTIHGWLKAATDRRYKLEGGEFVEPAPETPPVPSEIEPMNLRRQMVTEARHSFGVHAAREIWFKLGLPITPAMLEGQRQGNLFNSPAVIDLSEESAA